METRVVRNAKDGIKVLGDGELTRPLTVRVHAFSQIRGGEDRGRRRQHRGDLRCLTR